MITPFGLLVGLFATAFGFAQGPVAGGRELFALDATNQTGGGLPATARLLRGGLAVTTRDGVRMLRAATPTEFVVTLPEVLPQDFTLEFDIVPKQCCNPEDLAVEGTATLSRSSGSAHVVWSRDAVSVVGGGPMYQATMPGDLRESLAGQLTSILISVEGETVKLYTNGRRIYTLMERRFARGRVLRVFLGGQDDDEQAVYLARLRVAAGAATVVTQQLSGQRAETVTRSGSGGSGGSGGGGGVRSAGGTVATATTTTTTVAPRASAGATGTGPVATATSTTQQPAVATPLTALLVEPTSATGMVSPASAPPPEPPPPPPAAPAAPIPPIGMGEMSTLEGQPALEPDPAAEPALEPDPAAEPALEPPQDPIVSSVMVIDGKAFHVMLRKGGSTSGQVVELVLSDGTVKKHLASTTIEPMVIDVLPGSPLDAWMQSQLTAGMSQKTGYLAGGSVPAGQKLEFLNGMLTSMTLPALVAASTAPGFLRYTMVVEQTLLTPLATPPAATSGTAWRLSDFRFTMGDLETAIAARLEPVSASFEVRQNDLGEQRIATTTFGNRRVSNVRLTIAPDATRTGQKWLAWYDDFVLKGNNGDDKERTFLLELGLNANLTAGARFRLQGSGVGIMAVRSLPQAAGSAAPLLQVDLYVEKLSLVP